MCDEARALGEGFPAVLTLIGLLSGVGSEVFHQPRVGGEGLPAFLTLIGLLPSVGSHVPVKV